MSHRKFEAPRHGSLGFLPRKRAQYHRGQLRAHRKDDPSAPIHLSGFIGIKAGMTHIVREMDRPGSKLHKKEVVEAVTVIETPAMVVVGVIGYEETEKGLKIVDVVWAQHIAETCKRRLRKNWAISTKTVFSEYGKKYENGAAEIHRKLSAIKARSCVVRAIAHTQLDNLNVKQKKAHIIELQVNGGQVAEKVDWVFGHLEKEVAASSVFEKDETIDLCGITKGHGFESTTSRWGTKRLQKKSRKGNRKVGCIGAWHPANVRYSVPRAGQKGYHHRVEVGKKIYRISDGKGEDSGSTDFDLTKKKITPMGGFPHYGTVKNEFLLLKGTCPGPRKRFITLRKTLHAPKKQCSVEKTTLKLIDTSSKLGHGRFQTSEEKRAFMGVRKKDLQEIV
ncbi:MAG: 60S ribosomal protein L3 [Amphiamblys sp. WSBS2006]|nr:MAG: 60S ribosomal protein L3 [Amphiamblys sp. WSBS2006]